MEGGVDFISSLPEEILLKVVSLIPCKEALKTAVLSDTWKNLWSPFQIDLGLDSSQKLSDESIERLNKIFSEFLKSFDYPEKLKINFQSGKHAQFNDEFLAVVTKGTQNDLYFDFSGSEDPNSRFNFVLDPMGNPLNLNCPRFSSLKSLHFRLIPAVAANVVSDLFTNFQFLECLTFEKCRELKNIDIRSNDSLLSLTILDCCNIDNIKFSAPKLRSFSYRGHLPDIDLINAPELFDVTLDLKDGLGNKAFDCEDVLCLLSCFKDVEKLTINGWLLEWLCCAGVIFKQLEFKFTKLKELWCVNSSMDKSKRDSIACFLDSTPIIEKLFVKNDPKCMDIEISSTPYFHTCWHDHHIGRDRVTVKLNGSPLKYLKQIELLNFTCKEKDEVMFMDLLLHRAANLKNMMMISPDMDTWKVNVVPSSQVHNQVRGQTRYMVVPTPFGGYSSYLFTDAKRIW